MNSLLPPSLLPEGHGTPGHLLLGWTGGEDRGVLSDLQEPGLVVGQVDPRQQRRHVAETFRGCISRRLL